ncbi:hypothetical protein NMY22_g12367 [Coprinellus aureogranulatus]|nr:hypothetical protein NMY22_g12367 [Coprinellus aureogranulatus]
MVSFSQHCRHGNPTESPIVSFIPYGHGGMQVPTFERSAFFHRRVQGATLVYGRNTDMRCSRPGQALGCTEQWGLYDLGVFTLAGRHVGTIAQPGQAKRSSTFRVLRIAPRPQFQNFARLTPPYACLINRYAALLTDMEWDGLALTGGVVGKSRI